MKKKWLHADLATAAAAVQGETETQKLFINSVQSSFKKVRQIVHYPISIINKQKEVLESYVKKNYGMVILLFVDAIFTINFSMLKSMLIW